MTTIDTDPLERAAELLRSYAHELQEGHTSRRAPNDWTGEDEAKAAYDEHLAVADALERERERVQKLERELASIGAGGVEPLREWRMPPQWVPVAERLPEFMQPCDWLHHDEIKQECWVLCGESMATASVPGSATHWRPAQPLPPRARGAQGDSNG